MRTRVAESLKTKQTIRRRAFDVAPIGGGRPRKTERRTARFRRHWRGYSTSTVVGIDWTGSAIAVAEMTHSNGELGLVKRFYATWPDDFSPLAKPDLAGLWIRKQLEANGINASAVIVSVPRRDTVLRLMEVPAVSPSELDALVRMQLRARSSVEIEDLHLDYLPQTTQTADGTTHVLVVTVPRRTIDVITAVMDAADLTVQQFGVGELALSTLESESDQRGTTLFALANRKKLELVLVHDGVPVASHAAPMREASTDVGRTLKALVHRMIRGLPKSLDVGRLSQISLLGPNAAALQDSISTWFAAPTKLIETPCLDSVRLFAIYGSLFDASTRVDFLHPRSELDGHSQRIQTRTMALMAIVVLLLSCIGLYSYNAALTNKIATLGRERQSIQKRIKADAGQLGMLQQISEWDESANWDLVWQQFTKALPTAKEAYLTRLQWTHNAQRAPHIEAKGVACDTDTVLAMHRALLSGHFQVEPQEILNSSDEKYPRQFQLNVTANGTANPDH